VSKDYQSLSATELGAEAEREPGRVRVGVGLGVRGAGMRRKTGEEVSQTLFDGAPPAVRASCISDQLPSPKQIVGRWWW